MEAVSTGYLVAALFFVMAICLFEAIIMLTVFSLDNKLSDLRDDQEKANEGLVYCKLGENYVWLTKKEYADILLTDNGE